LNLNQCWNVEIQNKNFVRIKKFYKPCARAHTSIRTSGQNWMCGNVCSAHDLEIRSQITEYRCSDFLIIAQIKMYFINLFCENHPYLLSHDQKYHVCWAQIDFFLNFDHWISLIRTLNFKHFPAPTGLIKNLLQV
jgi:hypothetical protein